MNIMNHAISGQEMRPVALNPELGGFARFAGIGRALTEVSGYAALLAYFNTALIDGQPGSGRLEIRNGRALARFCGLTLFSAFQPIVCARSGRVIAREALVRATDPSGVAVAPPEVFKLPHSGQGLVYLDRLCRTMHALNFNWVAAEDEVLFLNVDGRHLLTVGSGEHGSVFERLLTHCGLSPARVVLEILESRVDDINLLATAVAAWQQRGFRIALDDFGSEHSNFDRLWRVAPNIVKLDRTIIRQATGCSRVRRILPKLVAIIHDLDALVICEGIESAAERDEAINAGADLLQGFFLGRPVPCAGTSAEMQ